MVLITWCQKPCAASDLMNIFISAINFWTVQKEHLVFYLECRSSDKRSGRNWSLWGCDFALTLLAWEAGSGIFIKLSLSYIISVLNISNKLATGMCIQILWVKFLLLLIFLFPITVLLIVMHECPFGSEFTLCVYTEGSIFFVYLCTVFLGVNGESFCIEEGNPVATPLWRFPCKNTQWGGQGLGWRRGRYRAYVLLSFTSSSIQEESVPRLWALTDFTA